MTRKWCAKWVLRLLVIERAASRRFWCFNTIKRSFSMRPESNTFQLIQRNCQNNCVWKSKVLVSQTDRKSWNYLECPKIIFHEFQNNFVVDIQPTAIVVCIYVTCRHLFLRVSYLFILNPKWPCPGHRNENCKQNI